jgi:hypothetical protein
LDRKIGGISGKLKEKSFTHIKEDNPVKGWELYFRRYATVMHFGIIYTVIREESYLLFEF